MLLLFCVLTYNVCRYTDFLVNEILPSGIVVHLDSLARPSGGKQVDQTKTAKPTHSKLVGDALNLSSIPSKPVSATEQNDNIVPETVSHLSAEQALSSGDEADGGVMITKTSMTEHGSISENQASISEKKPLEMGIPGNTRRTEKVLLRQTSSGLVEVTDQNEAKLLLAKMKASHNRSKDEVSEQGPPGAHEPLLAKDGHQEDKETRQEPMNSSPSQWQAFAQAPKSFQVGHNAFHFRCILTAISLLLKIETCSFPTSICKLLMKFWHCMNAFLIHL